MDNPVIYYLKFGTVDRATGEIYPKFYAIKQKEHNRYVALYGESDREKIYDPPIPYRIYPGEWVEAS